MTRVWHGAVWLGVCHFYGAYALALKNYLDAFLDIQPVDGFADVYPARFVDPASNETRYVLPAHPATAELWVINLDSRPERWKCVEKQFARAPYPLRRFAAVDIDSVDERCPHLIPSKGGYNPPLTPRAQMCSNYLLWERSLNSTSDFVIVFEDDVTMKRGRDHWGVVADLLNGPCQHWDYLAVDMWKPGRQKWEPPAKDAFCLDASPGVHLSESPQLFGAKAGAHMQILRRRSIPALLEVLRSTPHAFRGSKEIFKQRGIIPYASMDTIPWHYYPEVVARTFQPDICTQRYLAGDDAPDCDTTAASTDNYQ